MSNKIIAIDGPAASGKSTIASRVAESLGWIYADSGSLYRGLTWRVLQQFPDGCNEVEAKRVMNEMRMELFVKDNSVGFTIDGKEPGPELRSAAVHKHVSKLAAMPSVRAWALGLLRGTAELGNLVMEGRDIGTVVFPDAEFKFFLDAAPSERARRRQLENDARSGAASIGEVEKQILDRDSLDSTRDLAPLKKAADAQLIDSTGLTIDEVVALVLEAVRG